MNMLSTRIFPVRSGLSRLLFRSSSVFGSQHRFYSSSDASNTLAKSKNVYGDEIFTSDNASEAFSVVEKISDIAPEASFQSLGLGGPSPIGLVQHALEFLHVTADLPWWGAIATGTVIVRLCIFPVVVKNRQELSKIMNATFEMSKLLCDLNKALKEQKSDTVLELVGRRDAVMSKIQYKKIIIPSLFQASVFLSIALAIRQISSRQIESLTTGGLAWFSDLTAPDPLAVLPLITASSILAVLFIGRDPNVPLPRPMLMLFYTICPVVFICLFKYEAAFTFYLCTNSVFTMAQAAILRHPSVQSYFNIALPKRKHQETTGEDFQDLMRALEELNERDRLEKLDNEKKKNQPKGEKKQSFDEEEKRKRS